MEDTRIVLIAPRSPMGETYHPPLGLCYIRSFIERKKGVRPYLFDLNLIPLKKVVSEIVRLRPHLVGITCFSPNRFFSLDVGREIKSLLSDSLLVLGGVHASFLYDQILRNFDFVDYIVRGEGEETFSEFIDSFREADLLDKVKGLAFRRGSDILLNERRIFTKDLDNLPFPLYIEHFIRLDGKRMKAASMITSRGCSGGCRFCSVPGYWGKPRFRSAENIIEEISDLVGKHRVEFINFMDDTFTDNAERVSSLCDLIKKKHLKIRWRATARVNTLDTEILKIMKDAGCAEISIGIESGNQEILNRLGKRTSLEKIREICSPIKALKIRLEACFIVGSPGESEETIKDTKHLMKFIKPDVFNVSQSLYLLPGTTFSKEFSERGFYNEASWLDRNIHSIKYLGEQEERTLTRWQMELIRTGWRSLSIKNKAKYIWGILKWIRIYQVRYILLNLLGGGLHALKKRGFYFSRSRK